MRVSIAPIGNLSIASEGRRSIEVHDQQHQLSLHLPLRHIPTKFAEATIELRQPHPSPPLSRPHGRSAEIANDARHVREV